MFAKVFGQIFDSSIAEDYNLRRMFMDLLVLADATGAVDMTPEAISRRTNVPVDEVVKYVKELCQPDTKSRSKLEEGKRLVPLDSSRDWGWRIVNYLHYRKIRDEAARREYFRDKQREHRKNKKNAVKDIVLTDFNRNGQVLTPSSASSSKSTCTEDESIKYCNGLGLTEDDGRWFYDRCVATGWKNAGKRIVDWQATVRAWKRSGGIFPSQKTVQKNSRQMSAFEIQTRIGKITEEINAKFKANGSKRVEGDGIDELKRRRNELQKSLLA